VVSALAAGGAASGFLVRGGDELPEPRPLQLLERLQAAVAAAAAQDRHFSAEAAVSPEADAAAVAGVVTAVGMIFGSAAALSAAFGHRVQSSVPYRHPAVCASEHVQSVSCRR